MLLKQEFLAVWALKDVAMKYKEQNIIIEFHYRNCLNQQEEPVVKIVRKLYYSSTRSIHSERWSENDSLLLFHSKIYVPNVLELCHYIITLYYNSQIASYISR